MERFIVSFMLLFCVLFGQSQASGMVGENDQKNETSNKILILKEDKIIKPTVFKDSVIKCSVEDQTVSNEGSYYVLVLFVFAVMLLLVEECLMFFTSNKD